MNTLASTSPLPTTALLSTWKLDGSHTAVGFRVRHMMITNVRGEFRAFAGEVHFDRAHPEAAEVSVDIEVASIDTRDDKRDADLLYEALEQRVLPTFYGDRRAWREMQKAAVQAAPQFSARRMVLEYAHNYYNWQAPNGHGHAVHAGPATMRSAAVTARRRSVARTSDGDPAAQG